MSTLVYIGAGDDVTPVQLGVYIGDPTTHEQSRFKRLEAGDLKVLDILESTRTFVFIDSMPKHSWSTWCCQTDEHFYHYIEILIAKNIGSKIFEHNRKDSYMYWEFATGQKLYYFYSITYQELKLTEASNHSAILQDLIKRASVLYQYGFYPETSETPDAFVSLFPNLETIIHQDFKGWDEWKKSHKAIESLISSYKCT